MLPALGCCTDSRTRTRLAGHVPHNITRPDRRLRQRRTSQFGRTYDRVDLQFRDSPNAVLLGTVSTTANEIPTDRPLRFRMRKQCRSCHPD